MTDYSEPTHPVSDEEFWANLANEREVPAHELDPEPADAPMHEPLRWFDEQRRIAKTVPCVDCQRPIGQPCVRVGTDEPLRKFPAHIRRILAGRREAK